MFGTANRWLTHGWSEQMSPRLGSLSKAAKKIWSGTNSVTHAGTDEGCIAESTAVGSKAGPWKACHISGLLSCMFGIRIEDIKRQEGTRLVRCVSYGTAVTCTFYMPHVCRTPSPMACVQVKKKEHMSQEESLQCSLVDT